MRFRTLATIAAASLGVLALPETASAQVDVRLIRPDIMVLLDTSGSMEFGLNALDGSCVGPDGGSCLRCPSNPAISMCAAGCPAVEQRNRWSTAVEVLTGSINNFSCSVTDRTDASWYDYRYHIPHHLPQSNGVPLFRAGASQAPDGILDVYGDRVRFGLMTFDNDTRIGLAAYDGMFSYGPNRSYRPNIPGCLPEIINLGGRRASTDNNVADIVPGGLISVGSPNSDSAALGLINRQIQEQLTGRPVNGAAPEVPGLRPFGGTPVAGLMEDAYHYWTTHPDVTDGSTGGAGDPFFRCRTRANILITDGVPGMDFRNSPTCVGGTCPYDTPDATAMRMAMSGGGNPGANTYVIAFNDQDLTVRNALEPIAIAGNTSRVYYANDRPTLASALASVIDTVTSVTSTRTPPVFGEAGATAASGTTQYRFNAAFRVNPGAPREGQLTRTRTVCQPPSMGANPVPTEVTAAVSAGDDFAYNNRYAQRTANGWRADRFLWTYVPTGASAGSQMQAHISNADVNTGVGAQVELSAVNPSLYGLSTTVQRDTLLAWLRGAPGTNRETRPIGDIFRSTPVFVGPVRTGLQDQTFAAFQQRALPQTVTYGRVRTAASSVANREPMIYVGSNDGILHAFNADTGEEVWGFVPPYLVPRLNSQYPNVRQVGVDGTPVVREIYYTRGSTSLDDANQWRTVMVVGLRAGGGAYVSLDVTDPYNPKFLWQFTDTHLYQSTGAPAIGTLFFNFDGVEAERSVAVLPGGAGDLAASCSSTANTRPARANSLVTGWTGGRGARRSNVRCWNNQNGQYLYVVDLHSGRLVRKLGAGSAGTLPTGSPLVGGPALFNGQVGSVTTRAYVGDADGTLWRADLSSRNLNDWWMVEAYDLFWNRPWSEGQPIVERPITTLDAQNRLVVAFGSGDPELLENPDNNRVASFTETSTSGSAGNTTGITIESNWEIGQGAQPTDRDFYPSERLTGQLTLFNGNLYFGTFIPRTGADACEIGRSRLWGVDVSRNDGSYNPNGALERPAGCPGAMGTTFDRVTENLDGDTSCTADSANTLLFGLAVQRPVSCTTNATTIDPITGAVRNYVSAVQRSEYRLVLHTSQTATGMGGTNTRTYTRNVTPPVMPARVDSWATVFE